MDGVDGVMVSALSESPGMTEDAPIQATSSVQSSTVHGLGPHSDVPARQLNCIPVANSVPADSVVLCTRSTFVTRRVSLC